MRPALKETKWAIASLVQKHLSSMMRQQKSHRELKNGGLFVFLLIFTFVSEIVSDIVAICFSVIDCNLLFIRSGLFFF
jgi:hypothetical protein